MPLYLLCEKTFSNDAMKPAKMKDKLEWLHFDKKHKVIDYFNTLKEEICIALRIQLHILVHLDIFSSCVLPFYHTACQLLLLLI